MLANGDSRLVHLRAQPTFGTGGVVVGLRGVGREAVTPLSEPPRRPGLISPVFDIAGN